MFRLVILAMALLCTLAQITLAADGNYPHHLNPQQLVNPAETYLVEAPRRFFAIYGEYPANWQDVVDAGLVQVPIIAQDGTPATLDNSVSGGPWDRGYTFQGANAGPQLTEQGAAYFTFENGESRPVWDEVLAGALGKAETPAELTRIEGLIGNRDAQRLMGIVGNLKTGLDLYQAVHGRVPATWQEFMESGLAPIDANSVNPVTGGPIYGDGRPNDIDYSPSPDGRRRGLWATGADGEPLWTGTYI